MSGPDDDFQYKEENNRRMSVDEETGKISADESQCRQRRNTDKGQTRAQEKEENAKQQSQKEEGSRQESREGQRGDSERQRSREGECFLL